MDRSLNMIVNAGAGPRSVDTLHRRSIAATQKFLDSRYRRVISQTAGRNKKDEKRVERALAKGQVLASQIA
jgi:hypothetical protein